MHARSIDIDTALRDERRWSVGHSMLMLGAQVWALPTRQVLPSALCALLGLSVLIWLNRRAVGGLARWGAPNLITSARVLLLPVLACAAQRRLLPWAAACAVAVFACDGLDGWIARRYEQQSEFGARYDTEADACFVLVLSTGLFVAGLAGIWVLGAGALRYAYVLTLRAAGREQRVQPRTRWGRSVFGLSITLFTLALWPLSAWAVWLCAAATLLLVQSFARSFAYSLFEHGTRGSR